MKVYFANEAHCLGKGTNQWKRVAGLPHKGTVEYDLMRSADVVLVLSNTNYLGEKFKQVKFTESGSATHRTAPQELRFRDFKPGMQTVKGKL